MNAAELHLMLNHLPVLGSVFGVGLLIAGRMMRNNDTVTRTGLVTLVLAALGGGVVFLTGEPAEHFVEHLSGIGEEQVEAHEAAAVWAAIALGVAGLVALIGLIRYRRSPLPGGLAVITMIAALIAAGWMAWVAHLGGQIRHPELRPDFVAPAAAESDAAG